MQLASSGFVAPSSAALGIAPFRIVDFASNWGPGNPLAGFPGVGTGQFVNGLDNTTVGQYVIVEPWAWDGRYV